MQAGPISSSAITSADRFPGSALLRSTAFVLAAQALLCAAFPRPQGPVNDFAGILQDSVRGELSALLRETREQTSAEIALVTVPSLDQMTIEEYANKLFAEWGIGKKGKDNGVLVLVAPSERKVRIEVGYGLEPILSDGLAGEIIRTDFVPHFRSGDYSGGIQQGVRHVAVVVRRNQPLSLDERRRLDRQTQDRPPSFLMTPFFALFIAAGAFAVGFGVRARMFFPVVWGGLFGGIPLVMATSIPFFNASLWILGVLAAGMFAWGYAKGRSSDWMKRLGGGFLPRSESDPSITDDRTSSSTSSGSSDSFSGGESGGGGASGSW